MMHARWWLLVFALGFASIKVAEGAVEYIHPYIPVPDVPWYIAETTFDYLKTNDEGIDEITHHNDLILMVAVGDNHIVGPGQVQCRHINPPIEQIVNIAATTEYYPLHNKWDEEDLGKKNFSYPAQCYRDTYGCITLVHNLCHIDDHDVPADFKHPFPNALLKKDAKKPVVGEIELKAVFIHITDEGVIELLAKNVKVVDFEECKKLFDPDNLYAVDPEEQICTERVNPEHGDDPITLHSALIFRKVHIDYQLFFELVGIESKAEGEFSLLTWPAYHCHDENVSCQ